MATTAALLGQRKSLRRAITMQCEKITQAIDSEVLMEAETGLALLEELFERSGVICQSLRDRADEDFDFDEDLAAETEYMHKVNWHKILVRNFKERLRASSESPVHSVHSVHNVSSPNGTNVNVKLERLSIPSFDGTLSNFAMWWNTFKTRIHENPTLSAIDRYEYLRSKLKGVALSVIEGLAFNESAYDEAIDMLLRRYGRKTVLINEHLSKIFNCPNVEKVTDIKALRKLSDTLNCNVRALKSLNVDVEANGQVLGSILLSRLPTPLRVKWMETLEEMGVKDSIDCDDVPEFSISKFLKFLTDAVDNREVGLLTRQHSLPQTPNTTHHTRASPKHSIALPVLTGSKGRCVLCFSSEHTRVFSCPKYDKSSVKMRNDLVRKANVCFNCLCPGHIVPNCNSKHSCRYCFSRHHSSLCKKGEASSSEESPTKEGSEVNRGLTLSVADIPPKQSTVMHCAKATTPLGNVILQTVVVEAQGPTGKVRRVRVLLDGGCNQSFVKEDVVRSLDLQVTSKSSLVINYFNEGMVAKEFDVVDINLRSLFCFEQFRLKAVVCASLCKPLYVPQVRMSELPHIKGGISFSEHYDCGGTRNIDILIGADVIRDILTDEVIKGPNHLPVLVNTIFGWTLHGPFTPASTKKADDNKVIHSLFVNSTSPSEDFNKFSDLELIGISPMESKENEWPEPELVNGRFQVKLPWKSDIRPTNNFDTIRRQQYSIVEKLSNEQLTAYDLYFKDLLRLQIIEPCSDLPERAAFLPYHGVWKGQKLRVVYDGSFGSPSINQLVEVGPNLLQKTPICVTSFRLFDIPVLADVEKAFLQISVHADDRDYLRFVWWTNGVLQQYRFCRIPFGLSSSPAQLNSCLDFLYKMWSNDFPETVQCLKQSVYCDNLVTSVCNKAEYDKLYNDCMIIFKSASLNLRDWSNPCMLEWSPLVKVLGLYYVAENDSVRLDLSVIQKGFSSKPTKRKLASVVAELYDPLGFISPWTVKCKLLMQKTWESPLTWDEPLPTIVKEEWQSLIQESIQVPYIDVERNVHMQEGASLHVFSDASDKVYATCVYLVAGEHSTLIFSRNRLAPKKPTLTIPRLELMGTLISVRAVQMLMTGVVQFSTLNVHFWTDSICVLSWLNRQTYNLKLFVRNRVKEIKSFPWKSVWHYCPSCDNPADLLTRGISAQKLANSTNWFKGPCWLTTTDKWPRQPDQIPDKGVEEIYAQEVLACPTLVIGTFNVEEYLLRFSKFSRCINTLAWVFRFIQNSQVKPDLRNLKGLTFDEKQKSLQFLINSVQSHHFHKEYVHLKTHGLVDKTSPLRQLHPVLDSTNSIMMATPRTGEDLKILLPNKSHLTKLLVWKYHVDYFHGGVDRILCALQLKYWIIKARQTIRSQVKTCVTCTKHHGKPFRAPEAYLAPFRRFPSQPFQHTGVDFAGPILVTNSAKYYILLFTCASVRAIHLEVTPSLNAFHTAMAFRRFFARRGTPEFIYSDSAKTFRHLSTLLEVSWRFIPQYSPWWGGWWERLIGSVKRSLRKSLHLSMLNVQELNTIIVEVEWVINNRPLTYTSDQPGSISPLRPIDFLSPSAPLCEPWVANSGVILGARWRHRLVVVEKLCKRWVSEYLPSLRKWRRVDSTVKLPSPGDVVFVNDNSRRATWPLAKVVRVLPSPVDSAPRVAEISLKGKLTFRAISLLYPLESEPPWEGLPQLKAPVVTASSSARNICPKKSKDSALTSMESTTPVVTRRGRVVRRPARFQD